MNVESISKGKFDSLLFLRINLYRIISFIFFIFAFSVSAAPQLKFQHIGREDGLATDALYTVIEDKNGFIWFGGERGVQRFDGNDFMTFSPHSGEKFHLSNSLARVLLNDSDNNIWIGTDDGLNIYNQNNESMSLFDFGFHGELANKSSRIRALYQSDNGNIWIGSYAGLTRFDPIDDKISHFEMPVVRTIQSVSNEKLLIGTLGKGLYLFDIKNSTILQIPIKGSFKRRKVENNIFENDVSVIDIFEDSFGEYVISTWGAGAYILEKNMKNLYEFQNSIPSVYVKKIRQNNNGDYWILSDDRVYVAKRNSEMVPQVVFTEREAGYADLLITNKKKIWVATFGEGIFYHSTDMKKFGLFTKSNGGLIGASVTSIVELSPNRIILAYEKGAISEFDVQAQAYKHYFFYEGDNKLLADVIRVIRLTDDDVLIQTRNKSFRFGFSSKTININETKQYDFLRNYYFLRPAENKNNNFLVIDKGEQTLAVLGLDSTGNLFELASSNLDMENAKQSTFIASSPNEYMLFTPGIPVSLLEILKGQIKLKKEYNWHLGNSVVSIAKDNKANLWVGNIDGDVYFSQYMGEEYSELILKYKIRGIVQLIFHENDESLWVSNSDGLTRVILPNDKVEIFDLQDGLQDLEFNQTSLKASDGSLYFGGVKGFNRFFPDTIKPNTEKLPVHLTNLFINGKRVRPNKDKESVLNRTITNTENINLNSTQSSFGVEFSAMEIPQAQKKITYAYKLDGYDNDWRYVSYKQRFANYTNIDHGDYQLRVKAKNRNGLWSEKDRVLNITISPPWWQTIWAYVAYVLLSIIFIYGIVLLRTRALTKRSEMLAQQVKQRTEEVEKLLDNKNQELTNVSHEFRTPLTLILGPIAKVIASLKKSSLKKEVKQLEMAQRNGYRLLRMVDQLLDIESFQVKAIVHKQPVAFGEITRLICESFQEIAKQNEVSFEIINIADINFEFTPDAYEKIILNLLSNAFKYTLSGGEVSIETKIDRRNTFEIIVADTGIGISAEEQENIFKRFSRTTDVANGAGIGLALVKSLVEQHDGQIQVESTPKIGSKFTVQLPIVNQVTLDQVKRHSDKEFIAMELASLAYQASYSEINNSNDIQEQKEKIKVLVVEDSRDMREFIAEGLSSSYNVLTACDGEQGLKVAIDEIPDLILSDVMMPKLNGYELTKKLREQTATNHIPIILLTAKDDRVSRMKGWQEKADEYLTKPFDFEELNLRIKNLLEIRSILQRRYSENLFSEVDNNPATSNSEKSLQQNKFLKSLDKALVDCYENSETRVQDIASQFAMSERQLFRKLKGIVDMSPKEYLRTYRLEKAKEFLSNEISVNDTSHMTGFSSPSYFANCFKAYVGCTPSEYIKNKLN